MICGDWWWVGVSIRVSACECVAFCAGVRACERVCVFLPGPHYASCISPALGSLCDIFVVWRWIILIILEIHCYKIYGSLLCCTHMFLQPGESPRCFADSLWASADLTHFTDLKEQSAAEAALHSRPFERTTTSTVFMKISVSLKRSLFHKSRISSGPVHRTMLQEYFSVSAVVLNLQCPVLGKINLFVSFFFSQESREITSYVSTFVQNILRQAFIWSILALFERCCRTWSWRVSPSDDKKKWIIGLFIMLLKAKVHY